MNLGKIMLTRSMKKGAHKIPVWPNEWNGEKFSTYFSDSSLPFHNFFCFCFKVFSQVAWRWTRAIGQKKIGIFFEWVGKEKYNDTSEIFSSRAHDYLFPLYFSVLLWLSINGYTVHSAYEMPASNKKQNRNFHSVIFFSISSSSSRCCCFLSTRSFAFNICVEVGWYEQAEQCRRDEQHRTLKLRTMATRLYLLLKPIFACHNRFRY